MHYDVSFGMHIQECQSNFITDDYNVVGIVHGGCWELSWANIVVYLVVELVSNLLVPLESMLKKWLQVLGYF
jgi:hypothetical protein